MGAGVIALQDRLAEAVAEHATYLRQRGYAVWEGKPGRIEIG